MKKRLINLLILLFGLIFVSTVLFFENFHCLIKKYLGFRCPGCGLTRGIKALLKFDIIGSLKYNILSPIVFIFIIFSIINLSYDIIFNKDGYLKLINKILDKYFTIIAIVLVVITVINNL